jgi:hypothetical protein
MRNDKVASRMKLLLENILVLQPMNLKPIVQQVACRRIKDILFLPVNVNVLCGDWRSEISRI